MFKVIHLMNTLREALEPIGEYEKFDLPSIAVVGTQSSGKTSLIEYFLRCDCLPKDSKLKTRCPLRIQCYQQDTDFEVTFSHSEEVFTEPNKIKEEIDRQTNVLAGESKGIVDDEIIMSVQGRNLVNLTLVYYSK